MDFSAAEWAALARHLEEGLDLPVEAHSAWLEGLTDVEPHIKDALARMLLQNREQTSDLLATAPNIRPDTVAAPLEQIGPYHPLRELGFGGMGSVWLAERVDG